MTNDEIISEVLKKMPIFEMDSTLKSLAIQVAKMVLEYKDKGLKEFWIADLLKETKND